MWAVYAVPDVRAAEASVMAGVGPDALMERAAFGLSVECARLLREQRGLVAGSQVVIFVGSGNNGGDALWAGAFLARRGARVTALLINDSWHDAGAAALVRAGGSLRQLASAAPSGDAGTAGPGAIGASESPDGAGADSRAVTGSVDGVVAELIAQADLVVDGILGIGGRGALRGIAAELAAHAAASPATVVAVDLPSGIDADTGAVTDESAVIEADVTVTFGCYKPGLLVPPGSQHAGDVRLVDIGLGPGLTGEPAAYLIDQFEAQTHLRQPGASDDKYTRGVIGVVAGSLPYPGAGVLCTGSARLGGSGFVRYAGAVPDQVIARWPEVVLELNGPGNAGRVQAWVIGPGGGTDQAAADRLAQVLDSPQAVVVDADALTLIANDPALKQQLQGRARQGRHTVLTPHAGEAARLGFKVAGGAEADRLATVRAIAKELQAVVLLKGHTTAVATPAGEVFLNTVSSSSLATAGSGDVLAGLLGSMLAAAAARAEQAETELTDTDVAKVTASAAYVHGVAGRIAADNGEPATALSVLGAVSSAIAIIRA